MNWLRHELAVLTLAIQFLTRLPVPANWAYTPERFQASVRYYPLVGAMVGAIGAVTLVVALQTFNPLVAILMSMGVTLLATGAFHEDGLADVFDGVGGGQTRERKLEIMKDSRIGTYGAVALLIVLSLKWATLTTLAFDVKVVAAILIAGHCVSRLSALMVIATSEYAREEGKSKPVAVGVSSVGIVFGFATTGAIVAGAMWGAGAQMVLWGLVGVVVGHVLMRILYSRAIGGYTGDCLGGVQQFSEIGFYLGAAAWL